MGNILEVTKPIYVRPIPTASFDLSPNNFSPVYCINTLFTVNRWSQHTGFDSIHYDFGDGFTSDVKSPNHRYNLPGQYTVKSEVFGKCGSAIDSTTITVFSDPTAKPDANLNVYPSELCFGEEVNISVYTQSVVDSIVVYTGDGKRTLLNEFQYLYTQPGIYNLEAIVFGPCGNDTSRTAVKVLDELDIYPSIYPQPADPCPNTPIRFSISNYKVLGGMIDFGDGNQMSFSDTITEIYHNYKMTGFYTVQIIYHYKNCIKSDTISTNLTVASGKKPYRPYFNTYPTQTCLGESLSVNLPTLYHGDTLDLYFNDGNHQRYIDSRPHNIKYQYAKAGFYNLKTMYTNSCGLKHSSNASHVVKTDITTPVLVGANNQKVGLKDWANDTIVFWAGSRSNLLQDYKWTFDDGSTDSGSYVKKVYDTPGDYSAIVTAKNVCNVESRSGYTIEITDRMMNPSLDFYFYPLTNCVNNEFLFDVFHSGATSLKFDFGDGTISNLDPYLPHVMHSYSTPGLYAVETTASNSCGENIREAYPRVVPGPNIDLDFEDKTYKVDEDVTFTNKSSNYVSAYWIFNRDINDTTSGEVVVRKYDQHGTYYVTLLLLNQYGCFDTLTKEVRVGDGSLVNKVNNNILPKPC